jgi:hypothetical protein
MESKPLPTFSECLLKVLFAMLLLAFSVRNEAYAQLYSHNFNNTNLGSPQVKNNRITSATWTSTGGSIYFRSDGSTQGAAILGHNHTFILTLKMADAYQAQITSISLRRMSGDNANFRITVNNENFGNSFGSTTSVTSTTQTETVTKLRNTITIKVVVTNGNDNHQNYSHIDDFVVNGSVSAYSPADEAVPDANGILYVNKTVNASGDGSSWDKALREVSQALEASARPINVQQIWVAKGTYSPAANESFGMVNNVKIYGGFEGSENLLTDRNVFENQTILKGNGTSVVYNDGVNNTALLDGFYIKGGTGFPGASTSNGGGVYNKDSSPAIINCIFTENESDPTKANARGGAMFNLNSNPTIAQCVFVKNKASGTAQSRGGAIYNESSSPLILNCTITENEVSGGTVIGGGICNTSTSAPTIQNCIIWNNSDSSIGTVPGATGVPTVSYNLLQGGFPGSTITVDADPQFANAGGGDYSHLSTSPAVNAGNPATDMATFPLNQDNEPSDILENPRVSNFLIDLGAFEIARQTTWHVAASSTATDPRGESWPDAFKTLQAALAQATDGDEIWVAQGEYTPEASASFAMVHGVKLYGGFVGNETAPDQRPAVIPRGTDPRATILKGNGARVINNVENGLNESDLLDRFTIQGGTGEQGAGMYNAGISMLITNCSFIGNKAEQEGGGIYNDNSYMAITNTLFMDNESQNSSGGGFGAIGGSCIFRNCVFSKNKAPQGGGGAISSFSGTIQIYGTTISANTSNFAAALSSSFSGEIGIFGSILYGNSSGISDEAFNDATIYFSLVQGKGASQSAGNLDGDTDPQFVNADGSDLHLRSCSPVINRSQASYAEEGEKDMDGHDRIFNATTDMGAYEFQSVPLPTAIPMGNESIKSLVFAGVTPISEDCETFVLIEPSGEHPLVAYVDAKVYVKPGQTVVSGNKVFVRRHFDLTPTMIANEGDDDANVTLFFTKQEFDDYNTAYGNANNATLPANLKIVQYHGTSASGLPETYSGSMEIIKNVTVTPIAGGTIYMVTFPVTAFSGFFVSGQSEGALPVTLTSFEAKAQEDQALLSWQTSFETNSDNFEIEHSTNGRTWQTIGQVAARQESTTVTDYSFLHTTPENGENLYRLKMTDRAANGQEGAFAHSRIRSVFFDHLLTTFIYPNPASDVLKVQMKGSPAVGIEALAMHSTDGHLVYSSHQPASGDVNISKIPPGNYVVTIKWKNGVTSNTKLVVTR